MSWRPENIGVLLRPSRSTTTYNVACTTRVQISEKNTDKQGSIIAESIWGSTNAPPKRSTLQDNGPTDIQEAMMHVRARRQQRNNKKKARPDLKTRLTSGTVYPTHAQEKLQRWLAELKCRKEHPTMEQLKVLEAIIVRITRESAGDIGASPSRTPRGKALFDMVHGQAGCGKSRLLRWIREAFEELSLIQI